MHVTTLGIGPDAVDYHKAWDHQKALHADVLAGKAPDTTLLLEHLPVYTAGRRTQPIERPQDGTEVVDIDRGGKITWHGPGQLVGYPIMRLGVPLDVVAYVRRVEELLIMVCAEFGLATTRIDDRSGVWVPADSQGPDRKVAAIGVRVARKATMHGFALNCNNSLAAFDQIIPCGITDASVTTLSKELGREITVAQALQKVTKHLQAGVLTDPSDPIDITETPVGGLS